MSPSLDIVANTIALPGTYCRMNVYGEVLLYPDFHLQHLLPGGGHPKKYACWCMMSDDNGQTWKRHGLIAHDPSGDTMMGEPCLLPTSDGNLACIIRCADQRQKPMRIAYSSDKGKTWTETQPLGDFGVMPQAALLGNGVAVLAFGRPGVHLMFSPDGMARKWVASVSLIAGDPQAITEHSCGYTRVLPISEDAILIAYSDFKHVGADGRACKAILVRKIQISRTKEPADQPPDLRTGQPRSRQPVPPRVGGDGTKGTASGRRRMGSHGRASRSPSPPGSRCGH